MPLGTLLLVLLLFMFNNLIESLSLFPFGRAVYDYWGGYICKLLLNADKAFWFELSLKKSSPPSSLGTVGSKCIVNIPI